MFILHHPAIAAHFRYHLHGTPACINGLKSVSGDGVQVSVRSYVRDRRYRCGIFGLALRVHAYLND